MGTAPGASAQILVGDVFVDEFPPWTDTFTGIQAAGALPSWGTLLTDSLAGGQYLIEDSDDLGNFDDPTVMSLARMVMSIVPSPKSPTMGSAWTTAIRITTTTSA